MTGGRRPLLVKVAGPVRSWQNGILLAPRPRGPPGGSPRLLRLRGADARPGRGHPDDPVATRRDHRIRDGHGQDFRLSRARLSARLGPRAQGRGRAGGHRRGAHAGAGRPDRPRVRAPRQGRRSRPQDRRPPRRHPAREAGRQAQVEARDRRRDPGEARRPRIPRQAPRFLPQTPSPGRGRPSLRERDGGSCARPAQERAAFLYARPRVGHHARARPARGAASPAGRCRDLPRRRDRALREHRALVLLLRRPQTPRLRPEIRGRGPPRALSRLPHHGHQGREGGPRPRGPRPPGRRDPLGHGQGDPPSRPRALRRRRAALSPDERPGRPRTRHTRHHPRPQPRPAR